MRVKKHITVNAAPKLISTIRVIKSSEPKRDTIGNLGENPRGQFLGSAPQRSPVTRKTAFWENVYAKSDAPATTIRDRYGTADNRNIFVARNGYLTIKASDPSAGAKVQSTVMV